MTTELYIQFLLNPESVNCELTEYTIGTNVEIPTPQKHASRDAQLEELIMMLYACLNLNTGSILRPQNKVKRPNRVAADIRKMEKFIFW